MLFSGLDRQVCQKLQRLTAWWLFCKRLLSSGDQAFMSLCKVPPATKGNIGNKCKYHRHVYECYECSSNFFLLVYFVLLYILPFIFFCLKFILCIEYLSFASNKQLSSSLPYQLSLSHSPRQSETPLFLNTRQQKGTSSLQAHFGQSKCWEAHPEISVLVKLYHWTNLKSVLQQG